MSRKQYKLAMALISCLFISTTIQAETTNLSTSKSLLDDAYIGIGVGGFVLDSPGFVAGNGLANIFVGYQFSSQLSAELSYAWVARLSDNPATVDPQLITLSMLANQDVSSQLSVYARIGITSWQADINIGIVDSTDKSGTDAMLGLGFDFAANEHFHFRQEYQYIHFDGENAHSLMFTASYHF